MDQISRSVVSDSLRPHESQHARPPYPSPTPGVHWDSRPSSQWCHPAISSSVVPFSSCPQSLPNNFRSWRYELEKGGKYRVPHLLFFCFLLLLLLLFCTCFVSHSTSWGSFCINREHLHSFLWPHRLSLEKDNSLFHLSSVDGDLPCFRLFCCSERCSK